MALPIRDYVLDTGLKSVLDKARTLRGIVQAAKTQIDTTGADATQIFNLLNTVKSSRDLFAQIAVMSGLLAYARDEFGEPTMDIVADLNALVAACDGCLSWIDANYPKDGAGYVLAYKIVNSQLTPRTFTSAQLATFSTQLGTLLAAFG